MFSPVSIKQEYSNLEDSTQNASNVIQTHSDYPLFTNQDVEYMYRQLPQFLSQSTQLSDALSSKNEAPNHQNMFQPPQQERPPVTSTSYLQAPGIFQLTQNHHQEADNALRDPLHLSEPSSEANQTVLHQQIHHQTTQQHQVVLSNSVALIRDQATSAIKHNGPGRPPKSSSTSNSATTSSTKKHKCQCEVCFKEFGHKSNLFIHMRTHNGERPYKCNQCDKCFTHSGNLAIHMRTHSGERPYACQICGKMFSHSGNLSTHLRTHSGVKPYKCSVCNKEFRHSGNLSIHERIHSGIKPFQCKVCGKEFYHSGNLTTHMKKHPRIEMDDNDGSDSINLARSRDEHKVKSENKDIEDVQSGSFVASGS